MLGNISNNKNKLWELGEEIVFWFKNCKSKCRDKEKHVLPAAYLKWVGGFLYVQKTYCKECRNINDTHLVLGKNAEH